MDPIHLKLIIKKLSGELSVEEDREFDSWLNSHSDNQALFKQIEKMWDISGKLYSEYSPDTANEWEKLKLKIENADLSTKVIIMSRGNWIRIAAAILAITVLGVTLKYIFPGDKTQTNNNYQLTEVITPDSVNVFYLPDSSKVILNKNSSISYAKNFADTARMTNLIGEAFFEVRKNGKLFIVYAGGTQVSVMGTSFDVKANEKNENVEVVVFEGKVAFSEQGSLSTSVVELEGGDKINFNKNKKEYKKEKNDNEDFWWEEYSHKTDTKFRKKVKKIINTIKKGLRK